MSVLMLGGSNNRVTDSTNTKKAMTIRKRPLMNPERISTRPYLQSNRTASLSYPFTKSETLVQLKGLYPKEKIRVAFQRVMRAAKRPRTRAEQSKSMWKPSEMSPRLLVQTP